MVNYNEFKVQNQIDKLIAGQFNVADDEALATELDELMSASASRVEKADTQTTQAVPAMPAVPQHQVNVDVVNLEKPKIVEKRQAVPA